MNRDDTWTTHTHLCDQDENRIRSGTRVWILPGTVGIYGSRHAQTREGTVLLLNPATTGPRDEGEWSAVEHRTLLDAVKPGEPFRQLGVYASMRRDCREQLDHIRKRVNPGTACMAARGRTEFVDVLLVSNTAALKQVSYSLQFTTISEATITALMGKSRKAALHASRVALTEPRDFTGAPRDLHGLGLINWHTANTANKVAILHQMLNGLDDDLANMAFTEMWVVSQQTGALGDGGPPLLPIGRRLAGAGCCPAIMGATGGHIQNATFLA